MARTAEFEGEANAVLKMVKMRDYRAEYLLAIKSLEFYCDHALNIRVVSFHMVIKEDHWSSRAVSQTYA